MFKGIKKLTDNKFLNLFEIDAIDRKGNPFKYFFASRSKYDKLKFITKENEPEGAMIYAIMKDCCSKIVLVRQYRYPINDYIYEMPAGLIDNNENAQNCAIREFREETGMNFEIVENGNKTMSRPFYTSVGLSDEAVSIFYGYATGEPTNDFIESTENIDIIIADKCEAIRILNEEKVSMKCALLLMQFINSDEKNPFSFLNI